MTFTTLSLSIVETVATITLSRPGTLNALNAAVHAELREALGRCEADDAVRIVVLTGEGRAFSSGQDLSEDLPRDDAGRIDFETPLARDYNPLVLRLADFPKVTIAALNGPAVGASVNIALACDIVVVARSAYLQEGFARIGLIPDAGGTWILPRLIGPKRALDLMLTTDPVTAEEALRMGLVSRLFEDATFRDDVAALAARLAQGPTLAYRLIKQAMRESPGNGLEAQLAVEAGFQAKAGASKDFLEGVAAFREKRAPRFEGH